MPSFSTTLEQAIHGALALANARRHELATLEHLLLALLDDDDAKALMVRFKCFFFAVSDPNFLINGAKVSAANRRTKSRLWPKVAP